MKNRKVLKGVLALALAITTVTQFVHSASAKMLNDSDLEEKT